MIDINNELYIAACNGNIIRVKLMFKLGADVHAWNNAALCWAAEYGHKDVCEVLLEHGADVHAEDNEALRYSAYYGHKDVCKLLIEHGADVNNALEYTKKHYRNKYYNKVKKTLMQVQNELRL